MSIIIGLTGGSGAGKTFLAKFLKDFFYDKVTIISYDRYYKDLSNLPIEEAKNNNFDAPEAFDEDLMIKHIKDLKQNKPVDVPSYCFSTYSRDKVYEKVYPNEIIIIEGIMSLAILDADKLYDYKIYIDAPSDIRLARRILRDTLERGYSYDSIIKRYLDIVKPMHELYIEPKKNSADFIFINDDNNGLKKDIIYELIKSMECKGIKLPKYKLSILE